MSNDSQLKASTPIEASISDVRRWFFELNNHPERYQFESHKGFMFTDGTFGEIGSRFFTRERFFGVIIKLRFVITSVEQYAFNFDCLPPLSGAWCTFSLVEYSKSRTTLTLDIGTSNRLHVTAIRSAILRHAIQHQIDAELQHIKTSIEHTSLKGDL